MNKDKLKNLYIIATLGLAACGAGVAAVSLPNRGDVEMKCMEAPTTMLDSGADLGVEIQYCESKIAKCLIFMSVNMQCEFKER